MKKTIIQSLVGDIIEIDSRGVELTMKGVIAMLEDALEKEKSQLSDAFDEGVKYGNSQFQTFDYPFSRYFNSTYEK